MNTNELLGKWMGRAINDNGFELEVVIDFGGPFEVGALCGSFTIPTNPCSGLFRLLDVQGNTVVLHAEQKQGHCSEDEEVFDSVELLSDGMLLYVSRGNGWEARGRLQSAV